jgi:phosphoesterase RecJ-like protein
MSVSATEHDIAARLSAESHIVVAAHENPDGDALGCIVALMLAAEHFGVTCSAFVPGTDEFPSEYAFLPRLHEIARGLLPAGAAGVTLYAVDCATPERFDSGLVAGYDCSVNIDHHHDNSRWGDINLVDPAAGSTTELLYRVFRAGGLPITSDVATALYVGLVTDTGRFQYSNTSPAVHRMAADLQECGVDVNDVFHQVYEGLAPKRIGLRTRAFERLSFYMQGRLSVSTLTLKDFVEVGASAAETEGLIDDLRTAGRPHVVALLREVEDQGDVLTRGSLRSSDGRVDVARIANRWGGGGHIRASGFTTQDPPGVVVEALIEETERQLAAEQA